MIASVRSLAIAIASSSVLVMLPTLGVAQPTSGPASVDAYETGTSTEIDHHGGVASESRDHHADHHKHHHEKPELSTAWNHPFALLFSLNNVLQNSQILSSHRGFGAGLRQHLAPNLALRYGARFSRTTNPVYYQETKTIAGGEETTTFQALGTGGNTTAFNLGGGVDGILLLATTVVAPYVGAGVDFDISRFETAYKDDASSVDRTTDVDNKTTSFTAGVSGILGAEWRIWEWFAVFAEYRLSVDVFQNDRTRRTTTLEDRSGGTAATTRTRVKNNRNRWLNAALGLEQGGALGLSVFW
ncbi:MAG: outer membrane beta-barrel protein [Myxococcota bacterium]